MLCTTSLECGFDSSPGSFAVVFWDNDANLVTHTCLKVGHAGQEDTIFAATSFYVVSAIMLYKRSDDLLACNWTDLFVDKAAVVGDTLGDPFKDTAGPSLHVLIKLLATITLVLAPLFV